MKIIVIGDGAWGTTLAVLLAGKGFHVSLWSAFAEQADAIARTRENAKFLPGVRVPDDINVFGPSARGLGDFDLAVAAVPTQFARKALQSIRGAIGTVDAVVSVAKGIENTTFERPSEIVADVLKPSRLAALSGPSHAEEVSRQLPATVVAASDDIDFARTVQETFSTDRFRVYTSDDRLGVELAGALKNVIAIAAGISDGLKLGDNAKAALITRGLVEMSRLGEVLGARRATFAGLAGMGDLITTCFSPFGRNLSVGRAIGGGRKLGDVLAGMTNVAEGVETTRSARGLADRLGVELPITREVYRILFEDKPPLAGVNDLMSRELKPERD